LRVIQERARERNDAGPPCEVVAYATAREAIAKSGDVDLLIIDTPSRTSQATVEIARQSHLVVQPTGPSADDLVPTILTFHELVKEGVPKDRLVAAICRVLSEGEEATIRAYVEAAGYQTLAGAIPERTAYREAQNRGHAISETRSAQLNARVDALMEALLDKVTAEIKRRASTVGKRAERKR
jgi:chromosome partitioning protein